jgi:hypothetical protein
MNIKLDERIGHRVSQSGFPAKQNEYCCYAKKAAVMILLFVVVHIF